MAHTPEFKLQILAYYLDRWEHMGWITMQDSVELYAEVAEGLAEEHGWGYE